MTEPAPERPTPDPRRLVDLIEQVQTERGLSDEELCAAINRGTTRTARGTSEGPERVSVDADILKSLRNGANVGDRRLQHLADGLSNTFGMHQAEAAPRRLARARSAFRRIPLAPLLLAAATVTAVLIYLLSDETYGEKILGVATIAGLFVGMVALRKS